MEKPIKKHVFSFGCDHNSEDLSLTTELYSNGDPGEKGIYYNQYLNLQSECNNAGFYLSGASLTPLILRELAKELDWLFYEAKKCIPGKKNDLVKRYAFAVNEWDNGGEQFIITTEVLSDGYDGTYVNQKLELCSYGNSAYINLHNISLNPENLRKLANELEDLTSEVVAELNLITVHI